VVDTPQLLRGRLQARHRPARQKRSASWCRAFAGLAIGRKRPRVMAWDLLG
jgi:hypothetical protein